jgi:alkylation response protein AidB-like acyl-CoA dehydrogenase
MNGPFPVQQEYETLKARLFDVLWRELSPLASEIEDNEHIPHERVWPILRDVGALGLLIPQTYGGSGLSVTQYLPLIAEVAKVHGGIRAALHVHNSFAHAVAGLATEDQKAKLLPEAAKGNISIAFALTEPDHGTGLDLGTTARRQGSEFVIDGQKWLITNSDFASHFIVIARTGHDRDRALSAFLVERNTPGLTIERLPETMGCKGGEHGVLTFSGVRIQEEQILGGAEGRGEEQLECALEVSRLLVAASSWGAAAYALELSCKQAMKRVTFGKPIGERQAIQRYLTEMATDVYALQTMLEDAAAKWDSGRRIPAEASMCKLFGLEAVGRVTDRALLVFGGMGYTRGHPIERLYRDARLNWLEEGTPTIQYLTAARELLAGYSWGAFGRLAGIADADKLGDVDALSEGGGDVELRRPSQSLPA